MDMKADDRHLNKTIKGIPKVKPIKEPQDCYKLGKIPSLLRAQLQSDNTMSFSEKVEMFKKRLLNAITHYFNDQKGTHASCSECGFIECEVDLSNSDVFILLSVEFLSSSFLIFSFQW